jgi:hypothetical protein
MPANIGNEFISMVGWSSVIIKSDVQSLHQHPIFGPWRVQYALDSGSCDAHLGVEEGVEVVWTVPIFISRIHPRARSPRMAETAARPRIGFVSRGAGFIVVVVDYFHPPFPFPSSPYVKLPSTRNLCVRCVLPLSHVFSAWVYHLVLTCSYVEM